MKLKSAFSFLASFALAVAVVFASGTCFALTVPTPKASKGKYSAYVKVSWSKVSKSKGYIIRRGTSPSFDSSFEIKRFSSASTKSYKDKSAAVGKTYYYWVCPRSSAKKYWYNKSKYAYGYRKSGSSTTTTTTTSSSGSISGPASVSIGQFGTYYLYVGGKMITSSSVKWSVSGSVAYMVGSGFYGRLLPSSILSSSKTVTVKAAYNGKTYTKNVTIKPKVVPSSVKTVTRTCPRHGRYTVLSTFIGCPWCKGEINW